MKDEILRSAQNDMGLTCHVNAGHPDHTLSFYQVHNIHDNHNKNRERKLIAASDNSQPTNLTVREIPDNALCRNTLLQYL